MTDRGPAPFDLPPRSVRGGGSEAAEMVDEEMLFTFCARSVPALMASGYDRKRAVQIALDVAVDVAAEITARGGARAFHVAVRSDLEGRSHADPPGRT